MNKISVVTLLMGLVAILTVRIIYKAWRSRQADRGMPPRPPASEVISPLTPPPVPKPVAPTEPVAPAAPLARVPRRESVSIHVDEDVTRSGSEAGRSRIFGQKPVGSGVWQSGYVTASSMLPAKEEPAALDEELFGDSSDLQYGPLTTTLAAMLPESEERRRELTRALQNAGEYGRHAWHNHAAKRMLGIFLPVLFCGVLLVLGPARLEPLLMGGLIFLPILGWALPTMLIRSRAAERLKDISNGMPDMLDLLNMCVSQGMTVPKALGRVSTELAPVYPALSKELQIVNEQSRIGSLQQALAGFSQRVDVPEVHSFTSLIIQTERMGTSMNEALTEYSDSMRETMRQRADQSANAATFKLLFPTVICLMPAVFLFLLGPAVIQLSDFATGRGRQTVQGAANAGTGIVNRAQ
ncbi:MAG: type II secretion system F family protein [Planctomycetota bacterium]|nr:MAG: type II secretion system F family protein [Planctomycetota bacterium]